MKGDATKALCEIGPQPIDRLKVSTTGTVSHSPTENVNNLAETTFDTSSGTLRLTMLQAVYSI